MKGRPARVPLLLRTFARLVVHGRDRHQILDDLAHLYARDRVAAGRLVAVVHFARRVAASALAVAVEAAPRWRTADWRALLGTHLVHDTRHAWRLMRRHRGPLAVAIGGLALAVAVVAAGFQVVNATTLRPYGVSHPASAVRIVPPGHVRGTWSYRRYVDLREAAGPSTLEAQHDERVRVADGEADEGIERPVQFVSGNHHRTFGARPILGRTLSADDNTPEAPLVAVISEHLWRASYAADPGVVGRVIRLKGVPVTVIGVMAREFTGLDAAPPALWLPLQAFVAFRLGPAFSASAGRVDVVGRLDSRDSRAVLASKLTAALVSPASQPALPAQAVRVLSAASPLGDRVGAEEYAVVGVLAAIAILVLVLASVNAMNLLLAAAATRQREVGVRLAMGATRARLATQLLGESLLLASCAGGLGLLGASWLAPAFLRLAGLDPQIDASLDWRVLAFAAGMIFCCGLASGIFPAHNALSTNLVSALHGTPGDRSAPVRSRLRFWLVAFQSAASMLLLVSAGLLTRSAVQSLQTGPGFDADKLVAVSLSPTDEALDRVSYMSRALATITALPSVTGVAVVERLPFGISGPRSIDGTSFTLFIHPGDAAYLSVLGLRIQKGRGFTAAEVAAEAPVAVLSATLARRVFGDSDPIGQHMSRIQGPPGPNDVDRVIIGIVDDVMLQRPESPLEGVVFHPLARTSDDSSRNDAGLPYLPSVVVRSSQPTRARYEIEAALRGLDVRVQPATWVVGDGLRRYREANAALASLVAPAALLSLALALLGTYGVATFLARQRAHELSVRVAVGASPHDLRRLLLVDGLRPVVIGLLLGLFAAITVARLLGPTFGVIAIGPADPATVASAALLLLGGAALAVLLPARRAARVDPLVLLRPE